MRVTGVFVMVFVETNMHTQNKEKLDVLLCIGWLFSRSNPQKVRVKRMIKSTKQSFESVVQSWIKVYKTVSEVCFVSRIADDTSRIIVIDVRGLCPTKKSQ